MPSCSARNCSNRPDNDLVLHRFPADPERRKLWTIKLSREDWTLSKNSFLCQEHFEESQYELRREDGLKRLRPDALPTLFFEKTTQRRVKGKPMRRCHFKDKTDEAAKRIKIEHAYTTSVSTVPSLIESPSSHSDDAVGNCKVSFTDRTHTCGELRAGDVGKEVILCGWVEKIRLSLFLILRDGHGSTQVVYSPEKKSKFDSIFKGLALESVIKIKGVVANRPELQCNMDMNTGQIEVVVSDIDVLNPCRSDVPFDVKRFEKVNEAVRLTHRYMDLRNEMMQRNLRLRSKITMLIRDYLCKHQEFVDVETPTLSCQTPGGAREFIVPTRQRGKYYSLTQSPQQFKQLLMAGGMDRYFQIARCYRDESTKHNRQPEFTQVDIEMSFVNKKNIQDLIEGLFQHLFLGLNLKNPTPFPRITYQEAMEVHKTDKPDTRKDKNSDELAFVWVEDFPLFLPSGDGGTLESAHHPFTAPHAEDQHLLKKCAEKVRSQHYDLVLNGQEIGGGSIRIHSSKLQKYILDDVLKEDSSKLNHLLEALEYGCPPHGGIALGLDRLVAILCGTDNIRDVIAFPKSMDGKDLMSGAPSKISENSLLYYYQKKT